MSLWRLAAESSIFVASAFMGIYGLGRGLTWIGTSGPSAGDSIWLGVAAIAWVVLARQMGRVHDAWPRRKEAGRDDPS